MRSLTMKRISNNAEGTFGVLIDDTVPFAVTLEPPWRGNLPDVSCIRAGKYLCASLMSDRYGKTFEVVSVKGRTDILFHRGNVLDDTNGCILIGKTFGSLEGRSAILNSAIGFDEFLERYGNDDRFVLAIIWT